MFLALITVAVISYSQDVTRTKDMPVNGTYQFINGLASDTLVDGGQDSIDFIFKNHNAYSYDKISIGFQADTVKGSDNGIVYSLYGKRICKRSYMGSHN